MMLLPFIVFVLVTGGILGGFMAMTRLPGFLQARRMDRRLRELSQGPVTEEETQSQDSSIVKRVTQGPLPIVDKVIAKSGAGSWLATLIAQSGMKVTPSAIVLFSVVLALGAAYTVSIFIRQPVAALVAAALGGVAPFAFLMNRKSRRFRRFEEQFPEALDLLSRAIRAGHAFQTAMGMVAEELPDPVGPEFKKGFDQQNFGLPLRDALNELAERVPILDVRFFVTAVLIQRDTGGNLAEILDNLAHVVRERFKIRRQIRVHTAHGRFTGWVLLALPAALAVALSVINPEHMELLFKERMGQMMIAGAIVMQTIGYIWIRQVIKIEV
jgi:tight adherence protein B